MAEAEAASAARERYDLVIVGGGILGCLIAYESARLGAKPLLLERDAFGMATSANSLRILHGGLRYLQSLDLVRFRESVRERQWFLAEFPDLTAPLPCLMPLYGRGLKRPGVLRAALHVNDALSRQRNRGVRADRHLPDGAILGREALLEAAPYVAAEGLVGAALWYDARMLDPKRMVEEIVRKACSAGATAIAGIEVEGLALEGGRCAGTRAIDRRTGEPFTFSAPAVVNAAGPWASGLLERLGERADPTLQFALAWNLLVDRPMQGDAALALTAAEPRAQTFFAHPVDGGMLLGTGHTGWHGAPGGVTLAEPTIEEFLRSVNRAAPALALTRRDVRQVFAGLLPTTERGSAELTQRPVIIDHGARGGTAGLFTAVGIKFTTARATAQKLLRTMGLFARRA